MIGTQYLKSLICVPHTHSLIQIVPSWGIGVEGGIVYFRVELCILGGVKYEQIVVRIFRIMGG